MIRIVLIAAALAMLPLAASAQREFSHDDPQGKELNYFKRPSADSVRLLTADGTGLEVRHVLIRLRTQTLAVDTRAGVDWRNENRVRLRGIPILGQLFFDRFRQDDIAPRKRIGTVLRAGDTLVVAIDPEEPAHPITDVAILNQDNAWFLTAPPQPVRPGELPRGLPAGHAFIKDGTTLLLLIEPSVLQYNLIDRLL